LRVGIVGGGILGLTLGFRLGRLGHKVEIFEAAPEIGGLAGPQDYGPFVWDRFYHCILPQDGKLIGLLRDLDLDENLRWTQTGTGYYGGGRFHSMSSNADFLRFPLLSLIDKARLGAIVLYASKLPDPYPLYRVTARDWLTKLCGRRGYEVFWRPLLKAKFGPFHDQVAAVFIWATLKRLYGARSATTAREKLGYVSGGYRHVLVRFRDRLAALGAVIHDGAPVSAIEPAPAGAAAAGCEIAFEKRGERRTTRVDQVFFTGPTRLARGVAKGAFLPVVERAERTYPTGSSYLGVACLVLALKRSLIPYYLLNIGLDDTELTGVVEMTNLIDRQVETKGHHLIYLPKYLDSADERMNDPDDALTTTLERGLTRLFPDYKPAEAVYRKIHRARFVQPLPLVRDAQVSESFPTLEAPFQVLNTSMLACATLNNNDVVGFVDRFVNENGARFPLTS